MILCENAIGKDRLNGPIQVKGSLNKTDRFFLNPRLSGRFEVPKRQTEILNTRKMVHIRVERPPIVKLVNKLRILQPRSIELEGIVKRAFWRIPLKENRKVVRDEGAINPSPVGPK